MDITEVWKDIDGYDGKYQVSNLGKVRSIGKNRIITLKPMTQKNGYLYVALWKDNKKKNKLIHRLVALAFVDNPNDYPEVNHKDENKENNEAKNLEWCEHLYNMNYGEIKEKISNAMLNNPKNSKMVYQYSKDGVLIRSWQSSEEIERELGYCSRDIRLCCQNHSGCPYGFIWSEYENYDIQNHIIHKGNKSGVTGVCWHSRDKKWQASLMISRNKINLGCFNNKEDAIKVRLQAEYDYLGDNAPQKHLFNKYNIILKGENEND